MKCNECLASVAAAANKEKQMMVWITTVTGQVWMMHIDSSTDLVKETAPDTGM